MHSNSNVSAKRDREAAGLNLESEFATQPKLRRIVSSPPPQGFMNVAIISQYFDISKNVVWMNDSDYDFFFGSHTVTRSISAQRHYVQIASSMYEVAKKEWLEDNTLGLSPGQMRDCENAGALFPGAEGQCLQVTAYEPPREVNALTSMVFELSESKGFATPTLDLKTYDLIELQILCGHKLRRKYAAPGQVFFIDHPREPHERLKLKVQEMSFESTGMTKEKSPENYFGLISEQTIFDFRAKYSNMSIAMPIIDARVKFVFKVTISDAAKNTTPRPLILDFESLVKKVKASFHDKKFAIGGVGSIDYQGKMLKLSLTGIGYNEIGPPRNVPAKLYQLNYHFDNHALKLIAGKEIEFTHGSALMADKLQVAIVSAKKRADSRPNGEYKYIDAWELEIAIKKIAANFIIGQHFYLHLPNSSVEIEIKTAQSSDPSAENEFKGCKRLWKVAEKSSVSFTPAPQGKWPLIDHMGMEKVENVVLKVEVMSKQAVKISEQHIKEAARKGMANGIFQGQVFKSTLEGHTYAFTVLSFDFSGKAMRKVKYGLLGMTSKDTEIKLANKSPSLAITSKSHMQDPIEQLKKMGFGGLSDNGKEVIEEIVWERRSLVKELMDKQGLQPTKGLLLYGPPGTGKTFLARCLGSMLDCSEDHIQVLSGTKVYNKWAGESEANVRALFAPALEASKKFKSDSEIFLLVIDEIDGILSHRSSGDGNNWRNGVVAEFLSQMDGLEQFHNILVVGTTNRLKDLDDAVIRSGRFEKQVEFNLPDRQGRKEILQIHTLKMHEHALLSGAIDFDALAADTDGMSGADIKLFVKMAANCSRKRVISFVKAHKEKITAEDVGDRQEALTSMEDFRKALAQFRIEHPFKTSKVPEGMYT